jgi:glycogen operon protein
MRAGSSSLSGVGSARGEAFSRGASLTAEGVNFSLFSRTAEGVSLLLFDRPDAASSFRAIPLDSRTNRSYHYWHAFVAGLQAGQLYGYRIQGPSDPANGRRFDDSKVLLGPYGRGVVVPNRYSRASASLPGDNSSTAM